MTKGKAGYKLGTGDKLGNPLLGEEGLSFKAVLRSLLRSQGPFKLVCTLLSIHLLFVVK